MIPDKQLFTGDMVLKLKENMPAIMNNEPDPVEEEDLRLWRLALDIYRFIENGMPVADVIALLKAEKAQGEK